MMDQLPDIEKVIVEDSNAGFEFFSALRIKGNPIVLSSEGKSNVFKRLLETAPSERCLVIADGAAFGCEIDRVMKRIKDSENVILYLPESFEWILLKSGLIDGNRVREILEHPENNIDSEKYFSWERFFTALLIEETKDTYLQYSKGKLNPVYLHDMEKSSVCKAMEMIEDLIE